MTWPGIGYIRFTVRGFVDYWPTFNAYSEDAPKALVVGNFAYIQSSMPVEPYDGWLRRDDSATSAAVYAGLRAKNIRVISLSDSDQQVIEAKRSPLLQGTNGALTLAFFAVLIAGATGQVFYWLVSTGARNTEIGVSRAMGMSRRAVTAMLVWEQLVTSCYAVCAGMLAGGVAGKLFVPLLGLSFGPAEQVPPFRVIVDRTDYILLPVLFAFVFLICAGISAYISNRLRVYAVIKLGED